MSSIFTSTLKRLFNRAILASVIFIAPAYAIKWGQLHPRIDWPHYLQTAWAVGLASSPLAHHEFYSSHFRWQELSCLMIYLLVSLQAEYLLARHGAAEAEAMPLPRTKKGWLIYTSDEDRLLRVGTCSFLFLFVAACALCERTQMGTIAVSASIESIIRDVGIVLTTYFLFKSMTIAAQGLAANGMVVRTDIVRIYILVVYSLVGLSLAFCCWFPLLAIPGARIAVYWIFARLRESARFGSDYQYTDEPTERDK